MPTPSEALLDYPVAAPPPPGTAVRIAPSIRWLRMPLPFALDHVNLWLVEGADGWTLIDTGYGDAATRELWERHFVDSLHGVPIVRIVATHCHPDHLGNAAWLAGRFGCAVTMTHGEFLAAHAMCDERAGHAPADTCELFRLHGMAEADLAPLRARGNHYRRGVPALPNAYDRVLHDEGVRAGAVDFRVIVGYGHSSEHAALHSPGAGVLVSGDMLLPRISTNVAVWPADPDGDPLGRFLHSLSAFAALPSDTLVLPSHGLPFRGIATRIAQLRAHHDARLAELVTAIDEAAAPVSAADVVPVLFRRPLDVQQRFFAMGEALAHLNHLWRHDRIRRLRRADGTYRFARERAA
ncbi:MAG: MBL fold metallo-hydrolase [Burkholderiales bacterium]|nr:MBL fold metallo-hydrolase [Burkholderiales bacterium]